MRVQLVPIHGGPAIDIAKEVVVVGRKEDCDLFLDHKSVSKLHCVIVKTEQGLLLVRDLGSTNGTRVNGQRVRRGSLLPGDQFNVASLAFKVQTAPDDSVVSPDEHTQQIDGSEVQRMLKGQLPGVIKANALPDVYPDSVDFRR